jgi:cystathionine beta-lyase
MNKYRDYVEVIKSEGTYLMLIRFYNFTSSKIVEIFRQELKVLVEDGSIFECDEGFIRLNIACPIDLLNKALNLIEKFIIEQINYKED